MLFLANYSFVPATEPQRTEQLYGSMYGKKKKKLKNLQD